MKKPITFLLGIPLLAHTSQAAVIAADNFDYANGGIANQAGGSGWNNEFNDEAGAPAQSPSDWDTVFGNAPTVGGNALITNGGGTKREFGGAGEGVNFPSNEREGAFRGAGKWFLSATYRVDSLFAADTNQWGGVSSYDFGTERLFFGMPGQAAATRYFGIDESGVGATLSTIPIAAATTYTLLIMLDFNTDRIAMWVNPDGGDTESSYDVSRSYGGTNWSTAVRFASAGGTNVTWDNVLVTTTFGENVPETSVALLGGLGLFGLLRRRRS
ncbi:MAG: hypothetical protein J0M04_08565 [Verrucomicrobia bacterium]|nr:hypothetical protein [Verrucomicrobiota bacterium]